MVLPFTAIWVDPEKAMLSEVSQIYMWNSKIIQINLFIKQKQTHRHRKHMVTKGERGDKITPWC